MPAENIERDIGMCWLLEIQFDVHNLNTNMKSSRWIIIESFSLWLILLIETI